MGTHPEFKLHGASTGVYVCISIYIYIFYVYTMFILGLKAGRCRLGLQSIRDANLNLSRARMIPRCKKPLSPYVVEQFGRTEPFYNPSP